MTGHTMSLADFRLDDFREALAAAGATLEPPTNEWEILRYRLGGQFSNVYRNAKGRVRLCGTAAPVHYANFVKGRAIDAGPEKKRKEVSEAKKVKRAAKLARRFVLYTDASCYDRTKAGAWAAILVTPSGEAHEAHGQLKGDIGSSTSAEARAVCNGLHHFLRLGMLPPRSIVRVVGDNIPVINYLNKAKRSRRGEIREAIDHARQLAKQFALDLSAEWIKGHQPISAEAHDPRVKFNRRCDKLASVHGAALNAERKAA